MISEISIMLPPASFFQTIIHKINSVYIAIHIAIHIHKNIDLHIAICNQPVMTKKIENIRPVLINLEPTHEELAKLLLRERRAGLKERRKLYTFIADDRRSGLTDRRISKK
jgi:hypothetical protein